MKNDSPSGSCIKAFILGVLLTTTFVLAGCGGGGGGGGGEAPAPAPDTPPDPAPTIPPPTPPAAAFTGFEFSLNTGDFWEYRWDYFKQSLAQGSGTTTTNDAGRFWVVLGAPQTISGKTAYAVTLYGKSRNTDKSFGPRWKYLAMDNNVMYGSINGLTLSPIFDAQAGQWPGGGYFSEFGTANLITATTGTVANSYVNTSAIKAERSSSQSQCQYFPGVGNICGDSSYNYQEKEYHKESVGPLAYYYYNSYSSCGGGFCSSATRRHNLGMTASSLTGNTSPLKSEIEDLGRSTSAQNVVRGDVIAGDVGIGRDMGTTVYVVINGVSISPYIEDWYQITLTSPTTVTLTLSFEGDATADLDLYLMASLSSLTGYSVQDNPVTNDQHEKINMTLPAGTYLIGVDADRAPSGRVSYTLQVE